MIPVAAYIARQVQRTKRKIHRNSRLHAYFEKAHARLTGDWDSLETGDEYSDPSHPYALSLDLFGRGSLYQLVCSAFTRIAKQTVAQWMKHPATIEEALSRHAAIEELRASGQQTSLIESLAALTGSVDVRLETFQDWVESAPVEFPAWAPAAAGLLSLAAVLSPLLAWQSLLPLRALLLLFLLQIAFALAFHARVRLSLEWLRLPSVELPVLAELIRILECQSFRSPKLASLQQRVTGASCPIHRLSRLIDLLDQRQNEYFNTLSLYLLWGTQFTMAIDKWRRTRGPQLMDWLAAAGEFEALLSLAIYSDEHPQDTFPEFLANGPIFEAKALAHPSIPEAASVRNDVSINGLLIVSGSNMAGKSTFLRAVGVNAVLARMGAPVRCAHLRLSDLTVIASIRILDSLTDGRSRFLSEVEKLRDTVATAAAKPVLFLIDEIMSGTNSHDRLIAADAVLRALQNAGAIGIISTHDLSLTALPGVNVHFADDGDLNFDYKVYPGVVSGSNALNIVRRLGLLHIEPGQSLNR